MNYTEFIESITPDEIMAAEQRLLDRYGDQDLRDRAFGHSNDTDPTTLISRIACGKVIDFSHDHGVAALTAVNFAFDILKEIADARATGK